MRRSLATPKLNGPFACSSSDPQNPLFVVARCDLFRFCLIYTTLALLISNCFNGPSIKFFPAACAPSGEFNSGLMGLS